MWSKVRPTKPGHYWFIGKVFGDNQDKLYYVSIPPTPRPSYIVAGNFAYVLDGLWCPVQFPSLPEGMEDVLPSTI